MARKRKGRPVHGWLVIDKPAGVTSTQVVSKVRWALQAQKAGHAGTLDPAATGLLAVALGEATKTVPHAQDGLKTYHFTARFGAATDTDDAEGQVIAHRDERPSDDEIRAALPRFTGEIQQIPPQYSAVKVDGARAYDLAREGETLDLKARPLWVARLALLERPDPDHAVLELVCGKGGYVRSIARDLGEALGCLGHAAGLRRLASGGFALSQAMAFEALDAVRNETVRAPVLPVSAGLEGLPELRVDRATAAQAALGQAVAAHGPGLGFGDTVWLSCAERPVAIGTWRGGMVQPSRVFRFDDEAVR